MPTGAPLCIHPFDTHETLHPYEISQDGKVVWVGLGEGPQHADQGGRIPEERRAFAALGLLRGEEAVVVTNFDRQERLVGMLPWPLP